MAFDPIAAAAAMGASAPTPAEPQKSTFDPQAAHAHMEASKPKSGFDLAAATAYMKKDRTGQGGIDRDITRVMKPVNQPILDAAYNVEKYAAAPLKGISAVLGAPQRAVSGAISGAMHGGVGEAVNRSAYNAFHPNDEKMVAGADRDVRDLTHLESLKDEKSTDWVRKVGNFGVDTLEQAVTDPLTFVGAPLIKGALKGAELGFKAIPGATKLAERIAESPQFTKANDFFRNSGDLRRTLTGPGVGVANAMTHQVHNKYGGLTKQMLDTIDKHKDAIDAHRAGDDLHPEIRNVLDTAAYYAGTPEVREKAMSPLDAGGGGYVPDELAKQTPVTNVLTSYKPGYTPKQRIAEEMVDPGIGFKIPASRKTGEYGFNLEQKEGDLEGSTLSERMRARVKQEMGAARDAEVQQRYTGEFGLDRARYDTQALKDRMPAASPEEQARLQTQIDEMEEKGAAANERYKKYVKQNIPESQVDMNEARKGGANIRKDQAFTQATQELGVAGKDFNVKWSAAQTGDLKLKPGAKGYREQFSSSDAYMRDMKARADATADPKMKQQLAYALDQEKRRTQTIAKITERQGEIMDRENKMVIPTVLKDKLFEKKDIEGTAPRWLKGLSDVAKSVMFLNPIPHIKNISVLQLQGEGGMRAYANGNKIFAELAAGSKKYDTIQARLDNGGMRSNFFNEREGFLDKIPGFRQWQDASHDKLWQYDTAHRIALLQELDRKYGNKLTEFEKGAKINDTLFDYADKSPFASLLEEFGAPFPHWRLTNPSRQVMAVRDNPAAVNRIVNAEQNANKDVVQGEDKGYDVDFATPVDELGKAVFNTPKYFANTLSTTTKNVMPYLTGEKNVQDVAQDVTSGQMGSRILDSNVPFAQMFTEMRGGRYPSRADLITAITAQLFGANPTNAQSQRAAKIAAAMDVPNTDRFQATMHAR